MNGTNLTSTPRVRPVFRWALNVTLVLLALYVTWNAWDYVEARRLTAALEEARASGVLPSSQTGPVAGPEYADDAARFYQAAADLIPSRPYMEDLKRAVRDTATPLSAEHLAAAQAILTESAPVFELISRAETAKVHPWNTLYGRTLGRFYLVQDLLSFRTWVLGRTGHVDEAADSLAQEFVQLRALQGLRPLSAFGGRASKGWVVTRAAVDLEFLLNAGRPAPGRIARLVREFSIDDSGEATIFPESDFQEILGTMYNDRTFFPYAAISTTIRPFDSLLNTTPLRPWRRHLTTRSVRALTEILVVAREPWPNKLRDTEKLASVAPNESLNRPIIPSFDTTKRFYEWAVRGMRGAGRTHAAIGCARVALATEEYRRSTGHPPRALPELVPAYLDNVPLDPFSGEPLRYRFDTNGYSIYSVGVNGRDDGGDFGKSPGPSFFKAIEYMPDFGMRIAIR